ncbi:hypothetical protein GRI89_07525 [Altererythrobacter salegens]|uniref:Uncharacterized protein n=1 Tax=Croceibacterium salegens TaxID=1737568 RepID=A0A6I4SVL3_9SPHN|nr:hypothetical protein [Croceibacterium salegens]MXO59389.1 hypothetical protein [Croceibacterium salegens]
MKLPIIDINSLPDLTHVTGVFGSLEQGPTHDDSIIILATFVFETSPLTSGLI